MVVRPPSPPPHSFILAGLTCHVRRGLGVNLVRAIRFERYFGIRIIKVKWRWFHATAGMRMRDSVKPQTSPPACTHPLLFHRSSLLWGWGWGGGCGIPHTFTFPLIFAKQSVSRQVIYSAHKNRSPPLKHSSRLVDSSLSKKWNKKENLKSISIHKERTHAKEVSKNPKLF